MISPYSPEEEPRRRSTDTTPSKTALLVRVATGTLCFAASAFILLMVTHPIEIGKVPEHHLLLAAASLMTAFLLTLFLCFWFQRQLQEQLKRAAFNQRKAEAETDRLNRELMLISRQAGMAEVATGVLHNVGNVLNSINVSATLIGNRLRQSRINNLGKALGLLREHRADLALFLADDPKGKMLPGYLETLTDHLTAEQAEITREMESLGKNVEHVKEIVAMQQSYARLCGVTETLHPSELVQDAIRMNLGAFERHGVTIVQEFAEVPPVTVDKHKVLQILINLMRNAKYAMDAQNPPEKRLTIGITADGKGHVVISIRDNGVGIAADNLPRIFAHGFTTKRDGHGFGLHSGALAAREMGGGLTAASEGLGKGAVFCLELPVAQPEPEQPEHENRSRSANGIVRT